MDELTNLTRFSAARWAGRDGAGRVIVSVSVKATYQWGPEGVLKLTDPAPIVSADEFTGEGAAVAVLRAAEVGPPKTKVDVLVAGALVFRVPIDQIDVSLAVGARISKTVRVFGARWWVPGVLADMVPSRPKPTDRVPVEWSRSFGGVDPDDVSFQEVRNPAGTGFTRNPRALEGRPAPSFEDPRKPLASAKDRPAPQGFGAVAAHWEPRAALAGTYGEAWRARRCPLPPEDFDARFFNVAPDDQQMDRYVPGEEVRLTYMSRGGHDAFRLPPLSAPVTFVTNDEIVESDAQVDMVVIEPERQIVSVIGRAWCIPQPNIVAFRGAIVGDLSRAHRRALERGKRYGRVNRPSRREGGH